MKRLITCLLIVFTVGLVLFEQYAQLAQAPAPVYSYNVVASYPHDPDAFTQGLVYENGQLYEGTGLYGRSSVRRVDLATGEVLQRFDLAPEYFGEGIAIVDERIVQLTWREGVGFVYNKASLAPTGSFAYSETTGTQEGWGITYDGSRLIMSDGSATLTLLDPQTLARTGQVTVTEHGQAVERLNELEFINGQIFANVWQTDRIARIDPTSGVVVGWIDLAGLLRPEDRLPDRPIDVLNGIAYDAQSDRLFVTGKFWPRLYEIDLVPPAAPPTATAPPTDTPVLPRSRMWVLPLVT